MAVYKITPTKANLIKSKASLSFLKSGYDLLDRKRIALIKKNAALEKRTKEILGEMDEILDGYYDALSNAIITLGSDRITEISEGIPIDNSIDLHFESLMGVAIPKITYDKNLKFSYGLGDTNIAFDRVMEELKKFRIALISLAESETAYIKLTKEIEKTGKRANALEKVQIPKYEKLVLNIESVLEEKEREEFFRIKMVKKLHK